MNTEYDVWFSMAKDQSEAQLRAVRISRELHPKQRRARAWWVRQTGRALQATGAQLFRMGRRLECSSVYTSPKPA